MIKRNIVLVLLILFLISNVVAAEDDSVLIIDLGTPKYLNLNYENGEFLLGYIHSDKIKEVSIDLLLAENYDVPMDYKVEYEIDFKEGRSQWQSEIGELTTNPIEYSEDKRLFIVIDPKDEAINIGEIDLYNTSYSFRMRYKYTKLETGDVLYGDFSNEVILGLQPYYQHASHWAYEELDKAVNLDLIPIRIKDDLRIQVTREEFCEIALKLYELMTGYTVSSNGIRFDDTNNTDVLKASSIGIVQGVGENRFEPNDYITRQEIAVIIKRVLELIDKDINFDLNVDKTLLIKQGVSDWAIEGLGFMVGHGIFKGDENGQIGAFSHTTREEAVVLALRTFEIF